MPSTFLGRYPASRNRHSSSVNITCSASTASRTLFSLLTPTIGQQPLCITQAVATNAILTPLSRATFSTASTMSRFASANHAIVFLSDWLLTLPLPLSPALSVVADRGFASIPRAIGLHGITPTPISRQNGITAGFIVSHGHHVVHVSEKSECVICMLFWGREGAKLDVETYSRVPPHGTVGCKRVAC